MKRFEKSVLVAGSLTLLVALGESHATAAAVLVEADKDTVTKFIYVGGSPNNTTHPAVSVEGKAVGVHVKANDVSGASALVGQVAGATLPSVGSNKAGVLGAGQYGVMGQGTVAGVHGKSFSASSPGVHGEAIGTSAAGVKGVASHSSSVGVLGASGYGTGVKGESVNVGVSGEAEFTGVEGIANGYGGIGVYGYSNGTPGFAGYFDGDVYATGIYTGSDMILKEDVQPINKGLETVLALAPKTYRMKNGVTRAVHSGRQEYGLIAQDLEAVLPELVRSMKSVRVLDADGKVKSGSEIEFKTVNYTALIPVLIKAIQEQQARIEALEGRR